MLGWNFPQFILFHTLIHLKVLYRWVSAHDLLVEISPLPSALTTRQLLLAIHLCIGYVVT